VVRETLEQVESPVQNQIYLVKEILKKCFENIFFLTDFLIE
jgi:hypothetical protein